MSTLPVRVREVVGGDGSRTRSLHVFCPHEHASIPPETCARCNFRCPPEDARRAPAVGCTAEPPDAGLAIAPTTSLLYGPGAVAARVPAGAASASIVVCVTLEAPLGVVHRAIPAAGRSLAYPVVDDAGVLLGTVPAAALAVVDERPAQGLLPAREVMLPTIAVRESDHLDEAIGAMTSHHLRHVPIVDTARRVTGVLCDLDVLRWVARGAPARWW